MVSDAEDRVLGCVSQDVIFALKIDKWSIIGPWDRDREDLADHDVVVTPVIDPCRPALDGRECVGEECCAGLLAPPEGKARELSRERPASRREPVRRLDRILAEHGSCPPPALEDCLVKSRDLLDADEYQERIKGD